MPVHLRKSLLFLLLFALLSIIGSCSHQRAGSISGTVVKVVDGDTLYILDSNNVQHRIRLKGIDAPERTQAFYAVSRDNLGALTFQKQVRADYDKIDRYGRTIGKVWVDGRDACLAQIQAGLAWHFKRYQKEQSQSDRDDYANAEQNAKLQKLGLWQASNSIAPWDFRRRKTGSDDQSPNVGSTAESLESTLLDSRRFDKNYEPY